MLKALEWDLILLLGGSGLERGTDTLMKIKAIGRSGTAANRQNNGMKIGEDSSRAV